MKKKNDSRMTGRSHNALIVCVFALVIVAALIYFVDWGNAVSEKKARPGRAKTAMTQSDSSSKSLQPVSKIRLANVPGAGRRLPVDTAGFFLTIPENGWGQNAGLEEIKAAWIRQHDNQLYSLNEALRKAVNNPGERAATLASLASLTLSDGDAEKAYEYTSQLRATIERMGLHGMQHMLGSAIFFQGVTSLRLGENENCVICRGDSACILPIKESAQHKNRRGSERAIEHFTEYLEVYPDDLEVKWLLNIAHMTLGQYPDKVNPKYLLTMEAFQDPNQSLGPFRDVAEAAGINRFDQAGGAIVEDFDGDGVLDLVESTWDWKTSMSVYQGLGDGTFKDRTKGSGTDGQYGCLNCMQTDFNNDGKMDVFMPRGAWLPHAARPTLLRNEGDFKFTDVTAEAGVIEEVNSNAAQWADYDNDGWLDLFVACERQPHRLYRNLGNGKFEEVSKTAGIVNPGTKIFGKGCTWLDFDNDRYLDLFVNYMDGIPDLYRNNKDGTFTNVSKEMGIDGPDIAFSCWSWDVNNDGWLDIMSTCYERTLETVVKGIEGKPHGQGSNRLFINQQGKGFKDVTKEAGLDVVWATMGSNFGDLDNDGYLDFYLGTGEPDLSTLVPNRMYRNIDGTRFVEVTKQAGVGHLQKGHSVSFSDYDADNDLDIFIQMGGAVDGDRFRNILFQNPGNENKAITVSLIGDKSNRAAIGARIKVVTDATEPKTIYRVRCSGSSFGASALQQTIGIGDAKGVAKLEVYWPTSDTTQVFENIEAGKHIVIKEFADNYEIRNIKKPSKSVAFN